MIKLTVWPKNAKNQFSPPLTFNNFFCRCGSDGDFLYFFYNGVPNIHTNFQLYANYSNLNPIFQANLPGLLVRADSHGDSDPVNLQGRRNDVITAPRPVSDASV
jgi:hypothetical protein